MMEFAIAVGVFLLSLLTVWWVVTLVKGKEKS
jgi:uncharacterized membrane protein